MKKTIVSLLGLLMALTVSQPIFAAEPDSPGSKMITIQAGGLPGFGGLRLNLSDSMGIVLEGCYSNALPYASGGIAIRF